MWNASVYSRDNLGWHWWELAHVVLGICKYVAFELNREHISIEEAKEVLKEEIIDMVGNDEWERSFEIESDDNEIAVIDRMIANGLSWGRIRGRVFWDTRNERAKEFERVAEEFIQGCEKFEISIDITPYRPLYCVIENVEVVTAVEAEGSVTRSFVEELINEVRDLVLDYEFKSDVHTLYCNPYGVEDEDWGWSVSGDTLEIWFRSINPPYGGIEEEIILRKEVRK